MTDSVIENTLNQIWTLYKNDESQDRGLAAISIDSKNLCDIKAGVMFPSKQEAILVGFSSKKVTKKVTLPKGKGFEVLFFNDNENLPGAWFVLLREPAGNIELFTKMALDIITVLRKSAYKDVSEVNNAFIQRILAWQRFMSIKHNSLSRDQIVGLNGELEVLIHLLQEIPEHKRVIDSWTGPVHGVQDFSFDKTKAIEVKSYVRGTSTPKINIDSEDQLDPIALDFLFLCVNQFVECKEGRSLSDRIESVRQLLSKDSVAFSSFDEKLMNFGISDVNEDPYYDKIRLALDKMDCYHIKTGFPSIKRSEISSAIQNVRYEINVDLVDDSFFIPFEQILAKCK